MNRVALIAISFCALTGRAQAQQSLCSDPTPTEPTWWSWTRESQPDGSVAYTGPTTPSLPGTFDPQSLPGRYRLSLVHTVGPDRDSLVSATVLVRPDWSGTADAPLGWPDYLSFAPDPKSTRTRKSLSVSYQQGARRLSLIIGNPGLGWTDSGVILDVFSATAGTLVGRWVDGGLRVFGGPGGPHPQGWFCLTREDG